MRTPLSALNPLSRLRFPIADVRLPLAVALLAAVLLASAPTFPALAAGDPNCAVFPAGNPWNTDVSKYPVHPQSNQFVNQIGRSGHLHPDFGTVWEGAPIGIPYAIVSGSQPKVPVSFDYADESDPGPYPIPPNAPIEGGAGSDGDRHVLVIDDTNCRLYEMFDAHPVNGGQSWTAGSGAVWNLKSNALRPDFWTSADAAGLPIFAGLARYEEVVQQGAIKHALRFTVAQTRRAFIHPATHFASSLTSADVPPMGLRLRMKASYSCTAFSAEVKVICTALKRYGMFVADNGSDWYISGAPDSRWDDDALGDLKQITGDAFEVVNTGQPVITEDGQEPAPGTPKPAPTVAPTPAPTPASTPPPAETPRPTPAPEPSAIVKPSPSHSPKPSPADDRRVARVDDPGDNSPSESRAEPSADGRAIWPFLAIPAIALLALVLLADFVRRRRQPPPS